MFASTHSSRYRPAKFETLENRKMLAADLGAADLSYESPAVEQGEWFIADSFSFGVEPEMKESGEQGGSDDPHAAAANHQECTITKSMDLAATDEALADGEPICYLQYKLNRAFVKSWSTSGDADDRPTEEVAFYYNKIAAQYSATTDGKEFESPFEVLG